MPSSSKTRGTVDTSPYTRGRSRRCANAAVTDAVAAACAAAAVAAAAASPEDETADAADAPCVVV